MCFLVYLLMFGISHYVKRSGLAVIFNFRVSGIQRYVSVSKKQTELCVGNAKYTNEIQI